MNDRTRFQVGVSGSYGGFNLGDEAILQVIVAELRRALPVDITVFSRDSHDTKRRHQVERVVNASGLSRRETQEIVASLDLFILGGGGILYDGDADMYLREVLLAHEANTPVMVCAISAGPLVAPALRCRVRDALNKAGVITVRDRHARQLLEEIGVDFSALAHVPFVGLPYATKVAGFLEELRLPAPVLEHVSAGQLIAHIDRAWDLRDELRARIEESLPQLQDRAREYQRRGGAVVRGESFPIGAWKPGGVRATTDPKALQQPFGSVANDNIFDSGTCDGAHHDDIDPVRFDERTIAFVRFAVRGCHGYILEPLCTRLYEARQSISSLRRVVSMNGLLIGNAAQRALKKLPVFGAGREGGWIRPSGVTRCGVAVLRL